MGTHIKLTLNLVYCEKEPAKHDYAIHRMFELSWLRFGTQQLIVYILPRGRPDALGGKRLRVLLRGRPRKIRCTVCGAELRRRHVQTSYVPLTSHVLRKA